MLAKAFHKGFIETVQQQKLIVDLLGREEHKVNAVYSASYKALNYLNDDYKNSLRFEKGIAIAEQAGAVNPLTPAIYALHCYNNGDKANFIQHVEYLKEKALGSLDGCYWEYDTGVERFGIEGPWVSGISQGVIASVFIRKYKDSNEEEYLTFAKAAIAYCLNEQNGLRSNMEEGFWIEEYPSGEGKGVLNGFIFFLIGLGELASLGYFKDEFEQGVRTLIKELPFFHKGNYVLYGKNISDLGNQLYDQIHFHQLDALYGLTSISGFYTLKDYWRQTSVTELVKG